MTEGKYWENFWDRHEVPSNWSEMSQDQQAQWMLIRQATDKLDDQNAIKESKQVEKKRREEQQIKEGQQAAYEENMEKINQPNPIAGFFHGIDPATKGDYYVDVVHVLPAKPKLTLLQPGQKFKWIPYLCYIMRLKKMDPDDMIDQQIKLFNKFPPLFAKIDTSREDFLTNALQRKYGESKIIPVKFLNSGTSNTKFHLKQVGYSFIQAGYEWPNDLTLEQNGYYRFAKLMRLLKKEMMHELVTKTDSGRISFGHPAGKHNDLVHGWELSLDAVMEFQQKNLGYEKRKNEQKAFDTMQGEIYNDADYDSVEKAAMGELEDIPQGSSVFQLPY